MYCPRCGRQPIADELRFCSYCGFKLGVVKAALSDYEEAPPTVLSDVRTVLQGPRQRDINIGVILVFVGAVFATLIAGWTTGLGREVGALILTVFYLSIILLSGPIMKGILKLLSWEESPGANFAASRKGMGFGATVMFLGTIILSISSLLMFGRMRTTPFFIGLLLTFGLLLVLCRLLMRGLQYMVKDDSSVSPQPLGTPAQTAGLSPAFNEPALQSAPEPTSIFDSQRVTTAEMVSPSSITEHTTNLLDTSKS